MKDLKDSYIKSSIGKIFGFTLAEVLITLAIVGVVAAITIPSLLNKTNDRETVAQLQKVYSALASATNSIIAEEGPINTWNWDESGFMMDAVVDDYKRYMNFSKSCAFNVNTCYFESTWTALDNHSWGYYYHVGNAYYNILQDGAFVKFFKGGYGGLTTGLTPRMLMIVNLNGNKPPNKVGRDVFIFVLTDEKGVIPPNSQVNSNCQVASSGGQTCAARVMQDGAINY